MRSAAGCLPRRARPTRARAAGAGKSYTMMGKEGRDVASHSCRGLIPRIGEAIFQRIDQVRRARGARGPACMRAGP